MDRAPAPSFRSVELSIRPPRAVIFFLAEKDWPHTCERILEICSLTWGGAGFIIVPCDLNGDFHPAFFELIRAYDPDHMFRYARSLTGDVSISDPHRYRLCREQIIAGARDGNWDENNANQIAADDLGTSEEWQLSARLWHQLMQSCAPFHFDAQSARNCPDSESQSDFEYLTSAIPQLSLRHGLVAVDLINEARGGSWWSVDTKQSDWRVRLAVAARVGTFPLDHGIEWEPGGRIDHIADISPAALLELAWFREKADRTEKAVADLDVSRSALGRSAIGCGSYGRWSARRSWTVVVGNTADDFCFALCLDRMTHLASWLPATALDGDESTRNGFRQVAQRLSNVCFSSQGCVELKMTTLSESSLEGAKDVLNGASARQMRGTAARRNSITIIQCGEVRARPILQLLLEDSYRIPRIEPFTGERSTFRIETPIPAYLHTRYGTDLKWIVDVAVHEWRPLVRRQLGTLLGDQGRADTEHIRLSRAGISYTSYDVMTWGTDVSANLRRPHIVLPSFDGCFAALAKEAGFDARTSDKGGYTLQAIHLWGDLAQLADDLQSERKWKLLDAFRSGEKGCQMGLFLQATRRRYLSFVDCVRVTGANRADTRELLDLYLSRGIVARGVILRCSKCRGCLWYAVGEFSDQFSCGRCRSSDRLERESWAGDVEPRWYYSLHEVVYQFLAHDGHLTPLAIESMRGRARAFEYLVETELLRERKSHAELDFLVLRDGQLMIGEAKIGDKLDNSERGERRALRKLANLADSLGADRVVLASSPGWREQTQNYIQQVQRDRKIEFRDLARMSPGARLPSVAWLDEL